jgi:hypothetical protein
MRSLSRVAIAGALAAVLAAPSAMAANSMSVKLSPNKGGTLTVAAPTSFKVSANTPDTAPDPTGNTRLQAIAANLPVSLLFNSIPFTPCSTPKFVATLTCPSGSKLGTATVTADGGPDIGVITAKADIYFGTGFSVLAHLNVDKPASIDKAVIGSLRSSGGPGLVASSLYGLQLYIPVPPDISNPLGNVFPTVKTTVADFTPPTKSVKVPGESKKVKLPLAGLGPCKGKLAFSISILYTDNLGVNVTKPDTAAGTASCKK